MRAILAIQPINGILAIDCCSPMRFGLQLCNVSGVSNMKNQRMEATGEKTWISQRCGSWPGYRQDHFHSGAFAQFTLYAKFTTEQLE